MSCVCESLPFLQPTCTAASELASGKKRSSLRRWSIVPVSGRQSVRRRGWRQRGRRAHVHDGVVCARAHFLRLHEPSSAQDGAHRVAGACAHSCTCVRGAAPHHGDALSTRKAQTRTRAHASHTCARSHWASADASEHGASDHPHGSNRNRAVLLHGQRAALQQRGRGGAALGALLLQQLLRLVVLRSRTCCAALHPRLHGVRGRERWGASLTGMWSSGCGTIRALATLRSPHRLRTHSKRGRSGTRARRRVQRWRKAV